MKVKINNKEYNIKYSFKTHMVYENCMGKTYPGNTLTDVVIFYYCCLLANNDNIDFSLDEFINYLDDDPTILETFNTMINEKNERMIKMSPKEEKKTMQVKRTT